MERLNVDPEVRIGVRELLPQAGGDGAKLRPGGLDGRSLGESAHGQEEMPIPVLKLSVGKHQRRPELGGAGKLEALGHDAHHFHRSPVDIHGSPHPRGVTPEPALPEPVGEHDLLVLARHVRPVGEHAPQGRGHIEDVEEPGRDPEA